jgi:tripartite-type tricarboxylate transporter receptor subunit TctC
MHLVARLFLAATVGSAGLSLQSAPSRAQAWPQHTIRVIVPLPPGTPPDITARIFAEQLSVRWKQPVIIENIVGADGILAGKEFARRHDDHTLLYSFAGLITINPLLYERLPYDPNRDLVPIAMTTDNFLAVAASKKLNVGSLADLVKLARTRPSQLNWAATAGLPYFAFAGFLKSVGVEMVYVPYRDFNSALSDLGEERIEIVSTGLMQLLPYSQSGKAKLLMVLNPTRSPVAPELPTAAEVGYPSLSFDGVTGFFGWRDIPSELRDRIAADIRVVAENPAVRDRLPPIGIIAKSSSPAEFAAAIEEQRKKVSGIAAAIGTKPAQ